MRDPPPAAETTLTEKYIYKIQEQEIKIKRVKSKNGAQALRVPRGGRLRLRKEERDRKRNPKRRLQREDLRKRGASNPGVQPALLLEERPRVVGPCAQSPVPPRVTASQRVFRRLIETGPLQAGGVPVRAGLESGEQIVVAGANHLQAGMRIQPF